MAEPPRSGVSKGWTWTPGADTARYIVDPGNIIGPGRGSAGQLAHRRPHLVSGNKLFVFPLGLEAFEITGSAILSMHHYFGDNSVDVRTMHREEGRISMSGTFPGKTGNENAVECRDILMSIPPDNGLVLYAEGVFQKEQYVVPENWRFAHDPSSENDESITYAITFVRTGVGKHLPDPTGSKPPVNPGAHGTPRGKARVFTVRAGARTFKQIAQVVYGNSNRWAQLVDLNRSRVQGIAAYQLPIHVWPIGTKFNY